MPAIVAGGILAVIGLAVLVTHLTDPDGIRRREDRKASARALRGIRQTDADRDVSAWLDFPEGGQR